MKYGRFFTAVIIGFFSLAELCWAEDEKEVSVFDKIWSYAALYENKDNRFIQKFTLSGRLQPDSAWFEADQGQFQDFLLWRRFRFGFKTDVFQEWVIHLEADFDLNDTIGNMYTRLTDAYIGWTPQKNLTLKVLKQSAGFTLDGATSSKKLLTLQRNDLTNNLWFTEEYFTGLAAKGVLGDQWSYNVGIFSTDGDDELSNFEASYFTLFSFGYGFAKSPKLHRGSIRVDYVYNEEDINSATRDFSHILSLVTKWETGPLGLWTDISGGKGYGEQSNVWGFVMMPFYNFNQYLQVVFRYTYLKSDELNGLRLPRYASEITDGRGEEYNELYGGFNVFIYGHKLKWQTGVDYAVMRDGADDEGEYEGWGINTGFRIYW